MNKRYYEHTLPIIRGSLSNTYGNMKVFLYLYRIKREATLKKVASWSARK